jgi:hypothetical protein
MRLGLLIRGRARFESSRAHEHHNTPATFSMNQTFHLRLLRPFRRAGSVDKLLKDEDCLGYQP